MEGLTHWNKGSGSFGIGHLTWFPENSTEKFRNFSFSSSFFKKEDAVIVRNGWPKQKSVLGSHRKFLKDFKSERMVALRQFLWILKIYKPSLLLIEGELQRFSSKNGAKSLQKNRKTNLYQLLTPHKELMPWWIILILKAQAQSRRETYQGQGWGLKQVLLASDGQLPSFIEFKRKY